MQLPVEIQRAEILDWWEASHERISEAVLDRLPALYYRIDKEIEAMPIKELLGKGKFRAEKLVPIIDEWAAKLHRELTHELDESLRASLESSARDGAGDGWSYSEMAVAGAALAFSAAPVAGVPFFIGGLTASGTVILGITIGGGALLALPVAALAGSAAFLALGPTARKTALSKLKNRFRDSVHKAVDNYVLGDPNDPDKSSLKGILLEELRNVTMKRMEMVE